MQNLVDIPVTLQVDTHHLQRPPAGPAPQSGIAVASSAEELARLRGVKMAMLIGYHDGSNKGGGTFIHQPEGQGLRIGDWLYQPGQTVTPFHFGAQDADWDTDSGQAVQDFFDFCATAEARYYALYGFGSFGTNQEIKAVKSNRVITFDLSLQALVPTNDVLEFNNCRGIVGLGEIRVRCSSEQHLRSRNGVNGVKINDSRGGKFPNFTADRGTGWGVYFAHGNNNMSSVGDIRAIDMGATGKADRTHKVESVGYSNYEKNTIHQHTTIHLSENSNIPSAAHMMHRAFWISGIGEVYKIERVNYSDNTIRVYPMVPDAEQLLGEHHLCYGGAALCYDGEDNVSTPDIKESGHTAKAKLGHIYPTRCGIGMWITGASSANIEGYTGQFCGVDTAFGHAPDSAFGGSFIGSLYCEAAAFADLVQVNQTRNFSYGTIIGSSTAMSLDEWQSLEPKRTYTKGRPTGKRYLPFTFMNGGYLWSPGYGDELSRDSGRYTFTASSRAGVTTAIQPERHVTELHLKTSDDAEKFVGVLPITVLLYGRQGAKGSYHRAIPVTCESGFTINGNDEPLSIPNCDAPMTIHALLERGNNWIVTFTEHQVPS